MRESRMGGIMDEREDGRGRGGQVRASGRGEVSKVSLVQ